MANRYWVGGSGTWGSTTKWSATSGGASGASVPTTADLAIFDANSDGGLGAITVTLGAAASCGGITFAGLDQNVSFTGAFTLTNVGVTTLSATQTVDVTGITSFTLNPTAQRAVTGNGGTLTGNITLNSATADGITLQDNFTITGTFTLTIGNITLNGKTLSIGAFSSGGTGTRSIAFTTAGSKIVVTGTGTAPWNITSATNFTIATQANARVELTNSSSGTRIIRNTVTGTGQAISFYVLSGSDSVEIYASSYIGTLDFTGFSGTWTATSSFNLCGDLTLSTGMTCASGTSVVTFINVTASQTQTITTNGKALNRRGAYTATGTGASLLLADDCDFNETFTFNLGTLNLNTNKRLKCTTWTSSSATARVIAFGTSGVIECTGASFTMSDVSSFSYTGTSRIEMTQDAGSGVAKSITISSSATYAQSMNFYMINGVGGSLVTPSASAVLRTLDMSASDASLNTNAFTIYGDLILGLNGGVVSSSGVITFASTNVQGETGNGIQQLYTGPNINLNRVITKSGSGTLRLLSDLVIGTTLARTFTLTAGTLDLQSYDIDLWGTFNSSGTLTRSITHDGSGRILLTSSGTGSGVEMSTTTNMTITSGLTFVASLRGSTARTGTFNFGSLSESSAPNFTIDMNASSSSTQTCTGSVNNVTITNASNGNFALGAGGMTVYGNFFTGSLPVFSISAGTLTFGKTSGTQTLTTSGETFNGAVVKTGAGTLQMLDAWTTSSTFTHTQGTIDLNAKTLTLAQPYSTNNSNTRRIENTGGNTTGSLGKILVSYSTAGGVLFNATTSTGLSSDGNVLVEIQGAAAQTITPGTVSEANNPISFYINKSGGTATFSASNNVGNLKVNSAVTTTTTLNVYGNLVMEAGGSITSPLDFDKTSGTQTITSAAKTLGNITKNGAGTLQLLDALTIGATNTFSLTEGTFDTGNFTVSVGLFSCTGTAACSIIEPGSSEVIISVTGNAATILTFTSTGATSFPNAVTFQLTYSGSTGTRTLDVNNQNVSVNVTAGSDIIVFTSGDSVKDLVFSGAFGGTWNNVALSIYGNLTVPNSVTITAGVNTVILAGTGNVNAGSTRVFDFPVTVNTSGTITLSNNLTMGATRVFTFTQGILDINTRTFTIPGSVSSINNNTRVLSFSSGGKIVLSGSGTVWDASVGTGSLTTTGANLGLIDLTSGSSKIFTGGGGSYPKINQGGLGVLTIKSDNTFYDISNSVQPAALLFEGSKTQTFTNGFSLSGTADNLISISSTTAAQHTLSKSSGTVSVSFCDISLSNATGGATWEAYTTNGNVDSGNNTGWIFALVSAANKFLMFF